MFRKKKDPSFEQIRAAFDAVAVHVDAAQRALLAAVPTSRDPGIPLAQALAEFADRLEQVRAAMPAWRDARLAEIWEACAAGIEAAAGEADRLRVNPGTLGFEQLNARIGDVLHPLEAFADAERDLRRR